MDMTTSAESLLVAARRLISDYAYAIDNGEISRWPAFFTDPCSYRITTRENEAMQMPLSIMLCDSQAMLYDRVEAIERANIFEPHYYRHMLADTRILKRRPRGVTAETGFLCVRTMLDGAMNVFAAGRYLDDILVQGDDCLFRSRTVILDSSQVDTLIAIPL
ncbi:MAG: aromatic-ring-hydroxylating dioxygenase subunit beta [Pigmentiphaga sp.]|uniref:aromatic-ring-hydroxylating dioxygenase subunit beta n=1 Tax=Pigmentiphaga sp. TaxID=1977564 RepID=UPI0029A0DD03|nr:aromatic-ring-hydroxylating dioxygenase subunit beta [Pigmentiphaga sp.]MDX3905711.1 aromatic-ring-hydroxylating dioxygenase subunit beta [Pigmentiphaga sp.]